MANIQIAVSQNGKTTLATAGKYCERNIDINVAVAGAAEGIPDYVKTEADALVSRVIPAQGSRVFTLAAISDLHYGNGGYADGILHAAQALDYIRGQIHLDAFAVLGDYTDGYPADNIDNAFGDCRRINSLLSPMETLPNLRIQGNHDYYSGYGQFVHYHIQAYSEGVTWGDKTGGYFYRDFTDKKLRIICVNTTETTNSNIGVSAAQYTWFVSALDLSAKEDAGDWQILILSHHPLDWYVSDSTYRFAYILEAYKNGTSGNVGNIAYNFTGKNAAVLIGSIHGHIHNLLTGYLNKGNINTANPTKVRRISTPEACINRANQYDGWKEATSYNKVTNSADDTSVTVYCIDLNEQIIKAFCYGAGYDREISYASVAPTVYSITNILTNCSATGAGTITEGGTATVTVTAGSGYALPDTITVSGASYTWDKAAGTVVLSNPTGNVTVTVAAVKSAPVYTNVLRLAVSSDGTPYNGGQGWKADTRLNSSGTEAAYTGVECTGFIPVKYGDVIYFKNLKAYAHSSTTYRAQQYFATYDANKTKLVSQLVNYLDNSPGTGKAKEPGGDYTTTFVTSIDTANCVHTSGEPDWRNENIAYFRISATEITNDSIIAINEPIV